MANLPPILQRTVLGLAIIVADEAEAIGLGDIIGLALIIGAGVAEAVAAGLAIIILLIIDGLAAVLVLVLATYWLAGTAPAVPHLANLPVPIWRHCSALAPAGSAIMAKAAIGSSKVFIGKSLLGKGLPWR